MFLVKETFTKFHVISYISTLRLLKKTDFGVTSGIVQFDPFYLRYYKRIILSVEVRTETETETEIDEII